MAVEESSIEPFDNKDKLNLDPVEVNDTLGRQLEQVSSVEPRKLTLAEVALLTNANPALLDEVLSRTPMANKKMRAFIGGIAAAGSREAVIQTPPLVEVADAYIDIFKRTLG